MRLPLRRCAALTVVAVAGALLHGVIAASPAAAEEVFDRPPSGVFRIVGHGWGHGHGLSQWGAQGAASLGVDADRITAAYYPGTTKAVLADAPMRVWLQGVDGPATEVYAASGLTVTDVSTGQSAVLPSGPTRWRATADGNGLHLSSFDGSTWTPYAMPGSAGAAPPPATTSYPGPLRFDGPSVVRLAYRDGTSRDYRGAVQAVRVSAAAVQTIDVLSMEDYLLGVVPREASSSWQPAALQAQAIAARSYSAYERAHATGTYDICDSTSCQVFGGTRIYTTDGSAIDLEAASTTAAVRATAGVVRSYAGGPIFAQFSSSNGGWSTDGGQPYLLAQRDDWDGAVANPVHSWTAALSAADLERRYPAVGTLRRIRVTARDGNGEWGGRVQTVVLEGTSSSGTPTSVTTSGRGIANARPWPAFSDGLRSPWWQITNSVDGAVVRQSDAPQLVRPPGVPATATVTVTMRNTGTTSWPTADLHLAVASPPGQPDALVGGRTRPGVLAPGGPSSIAPGATATFSFALDAAGVAAGSHGRGYRLRIGSGDLFGETVNWTFPVAPATFAAAVARPPAAVRAAAGDAPPAVFADGRTVVLPRAGSVQVGVALRNTGNAPWPAGPGTPVHLGTALPRDRRSACAAATWESPSRADPLSGTTAVGPGAVGVFDLTLCGGGLPVGVTREAFEPVWDFTHWIDGALTALTVVRTDPAVSRLAGLQQGPPVTVRVQTTAAGPTLVVALRNLGGAPWTVGREWLATSSGRPDPLRTSAWPYPTRPPALAANASRAAARQVYPGEIGIWRIPLSGVQRTPGTYAEAWQPLGPTGRYGPVLRTSVLVVRG